MSRATNQEWRALQAAVATILAKEDSLWPEDKRQLESVMRIAEGSVRR